MQIQTWRPLRTVTASMPEVFSMQASPSRLPSILSEWRAMPVYAAPPIEPWRRGKSHGRGSVQAGSRRNDTVAARRFSASVLILWHDADARLLGARTGHAACFRSFAEPPEQLAQLQALAQKGRFCCARAARKRSCKWRFPLATRRARISQGSALAAGQRMASVLRMSVVTHVPPHLSVHRLSSANR